MFQLPSAPPAAIACVRSQSPDLHITGTVSFFCCGGGTLVVADICGLPADPSGGRGIHGFHIHEGSCCTGADFADTGGHFNLENRPHPQHAGDLPPLFACRNGRALCVVLTDRFRPADVVGRTVVIHSDADDLMTQPAGNAGKKIACGVIRSL